MCKRPFSLGKRSFFMNSLKGGDMSDGISKPQHSNSRRNTGKKAESTKATNI